jgi:hypothetical protein
MVRVGFLPDGHVLIREYPDFCLWAPSEPDSVIANTEGEEVAWCTKPGRGTRLIPNGALKGIQYIKTTDYVQIVGFIDQTMINIQAGDYGGELDPHGADLVCIIIVVPLGGCSELFLAWQPYGWCHVQQRFLRWREQLPTSH